MAVNNIRDTIITAFQITKETKNKVPMLLLSNPGLAKTSIINEIGQHYGYNVVSVIGSGFENNEILGFQVNEPGIEHLITKNPTWYQNIIDNEKKGIPSILFIDEISVCPSLVQGALYRLIFERTIGNGNMLPEDCVIMSAGNYKENLPSYCDITSPALNRFCIINLCPENYMEFLEEFSQDEEERIADWPEFKKQNIPNIEKQARTAVKTMMSELFDCYANVADTTKGCLNITNKEIANMFDGEYSPNGEVYNFISGRTYEYLQKSVAACVNLNVSPKSIFVRKMTEGLIGAGTGSFTDAKQVASYLKSVTKKVSDLIKNLKDNKTDTAASDYNVFQGETEIAQRIEKLSLFVDGNSFNSIDVLKAFKVLFTQIQDKYPTNNIHKTMNEMLGEGVDDEKRAIAYASFSQDIISIEQLIRVVKDNINNAEALAATNILETIINEYKFYAEFSC